MNEKREKAWKSMASSSQRNIPKKFVGIGLDNNNASEITFAFFSDIFPANFSMSKMILHSSLDPLMRGEGKAIVIPSKISSMWIHWPPKRSIANGYRHVEINRQINFFFHPRYWNYVSWILLHST